MAWVTVQDLMSKGSLPGDLWDANGLRIDRCITGFDDTTGEVESQVLDILGNWTPDSEGKTHKRREFYAKPLHFRKMTQS